MVCRGYGLPPAVVDMLLSDLSLHCGRAAKSGPEHGRCILVDILEKESEFEIVADVPGVAKEAIHLDIDKDTLTLSISQPDDKAPGADAPAATPGDTEHATEGGEQAAAQATEAPAQPKILHRERAQRYAKRALKLPDTADLGQARAECVAGVLTVTVPKRALPSPHRIPIV